MVLKLASLVEQHLQEQSDSFQLECSTVDARSRNVHEVAVQ
jgi:hypothetical protein